MTNKRHKTALSFVSLAVIELVNNNCYSISSQSRSGVIYSIERKENTTPCTCRLKCSYCSACPHIYTCTCLDACTNTTVCKHMHLIQMQQPINTSIQKVENKQTQLKYYNKVTNTSTTSPTTISLKHNIQKRLNDLMTSCNPAIIQTMLKHYKKYMSV